MHNTTRDIKLDAIQKVLTVIYKLDWLSASEASYLGLYSLYIHRMLEGNGG